MNPFTTRSPFFDSLKQVEDRLASEARAGPETKTPKIPTSPSPSPIFLDFLQAYAERNIPPESHLQDSSGPPLNFLSSFSCPEEDPKPPPASGDADSDADSSEGEAADDIERLMSLLGLSDSEDWIGGSSCDCSGGGFYSKVAGVRGPKCGRERKRLDGWIEYFYKEKKEPVRLAHLLMAKAWCLSGDDDEEDGEGLGSIQFPDTVAQFLEYDPPKNE